MDASPLREYQKQGIHFLAHRDQALLCDEPGLGKTRQMIECCRERAFKSLIICPRSIKDEWKTEIEKWTSMKAIIVEGNPIHRRLQYLLKADFYIINYELVLRDFDYINKMPIDCIVLDEAQRIKNCKTKTAQTIKTLNLPIHRYVLTATPIENRIEELYSLIDFIGNGIYNDLQSALLANKGGYSGYYNTKWGSDSSRLKRMVGRTDPAIIHTALNKFMLRRRKDDVDAELPPKTHIEIEIALTERQQKMYDLAANDFLLMVDDKTIPITTVLAQFTYLREICNSLALIDPALNFSSKMDELIPRVIDIVNTNNKVIIFSEFKRMCDIIVSTLKEKGIGVSYLHGHEKDPTGQKKDFWNKNQVMVATRTGEAGHNLQCASYVFHYEVLWNPARIKQREDRAHRLGQNKPVFIYGFITPHTIEERIESTLQLKEELFQTVIDRPEYREWLRKLVE